MRGDEAEGNMWGPTQSNHRRPPNLEKPWLNSNEAGPTWIERQPNSRHSLHLICSAELFTHPRCFVFIVGVFFLYVTGPRRRAQSPQRG